jgi:hypothetical protein
MTSAERRGDAVTQQDRARELWLRNLYGNTSDDTHDDLFVSMVTGDPASPHVIPYMLHALLEGLEVADAGFSAKGIDVLRARGLATSDGSLDYCMIGGQPVRLPVADHRAELSGERGSQLLVR